MERGTSRPHSFGFVNLSPCWGAAEDTIFKMDQSSQFDGWSICVIETHVGGGGGRGGAHGLGNGVGASSKPATLVTFGSLLLLPPTPPLYTLWPLPLPFTLLPWLVLLSTMVHVASRRPYVATQ